MLGYDDGAGVDRVQRPQPFEVGSSPWWMLSTILARDSRSHLASAPNVGDPPAFGCESSESSSPQLYGARTCAHAARVFRASSRERAEEHYVDIPLASDQSGRGAPSIRAGGVALGCLRARTPRPTRALMVNTTPARAKARGPARNERCPAARSRCKSSASGSPRPERILTLKCHELVRGLTSA